MGSTLEDVYCTLVMSDSYLPGAAVLSHSLRDGGTSKKLACMVTLDSLHPDTITELKELYDYIIPVDRIRTPNPKNLYLMDRPDLSFAFTKINLWRQLQFRKIVYIDADIVALRAVDELFDLDVPFAAAPDIGWPDAFNSGLMVLNPDMGEYWALQTMAGSGDSFDGADQGLLNQYYEHKSWHRLSYTYNVTPSAHYQWEPAYRYYKSNIKMVHFIGKDKPWTKGRQVAASGVYNELLGRWWMVYDKHLRQQAEAASYTAALNATIQQHMHGEGTRADGGTSAVEHLTVPEIREPEAHATSTEKPMTEPGERAENIDQGREAPVPTQQQRRFSAPRAEWDATRFAPPVESKAEASNFPIQQYEFSTSREQFKAPQAYPEPPKDMWYEVPKEQPKVQEPPKPIFPWEKERPRSKATRVFAEDLPPPTAEAQDPQTSSPGQEDIEPQSMSPVIDSAEDSWRRFNRQSTNAWDTDPSIDRYVRAVMDQQTRRSGSKHVMTEPGAADAVDALLSPTEPRSISRKERRESMILTDFPSAVERPSLPVTPAPRRRPTFWGTERDDKGELPAAEGVPDQAEWNPEERLDNLRRNSLQEVENLKQNKPKPTPMRALPEHSVPDPDEPQPSIQTQPHLVSQKMNQANQFETQFGGDSAADSVAPTVKEVQEAANVAIAKDESSVSRAEKVETPGMSFKKPTFAPLDFAGGPPVGDGGDSEGKGFGLGTTAAEKLREDTISPTER